MKILGKLFGSPARVKILRFFLFNSNDVYESWEITDHTKVSGDKVSSELSILKSIGFVEKKSGYVEEEGKKIKIKGWALNNNFPYLESLKNFLINTTALKNHDIEKKLHTVGKMKMIVLSGIFVNELDGRVDLLIVGDSIKKSSLERTIRGIEAELGKELRYAYFKTNDYIYRQGLYDRLIRDIFDNPHKVVLDKINP